MALAPGDPLQAFRLHLGYDPRTFYGHGCPADGLTYEPNKDNSK